MPGKSIVYEWESVVDVLVTNNPCRKHPTSTPVDDAYQDDSDASDIGSSRDSDEVIDDEAFDYYSDSDRDSDSNVGCMGLDLSL